MFKIFQEPDDYLEKKNDRRVAINSIAAQKQTDFFKAPMLYTHNYYLDDSRMFTPTVYSNITTANSYFNGREGKYSNSFKSVDYYNKKARARNERLIQEAAAAASS